PTLSSILTIGKTRGGHTLMQVLSKIMLGDVRRDWISGFCELLWTLPGLRKMALSMCDWLKNGGKDVAVGCYSVLCVALYRIAVSGVCG
ncbi:MAG: hypothetical protein IJ165_10980, partial [Proteobacteria bacterium]|nr:hypothetical protein [Pseudomonadota bacterium]